MSEPPRKRTQTQVAAVGRARCVSTRAVKASTESTRILIVCDWRSLARLRPALLFTTREDPRALAACH
jgi:hypothetical protein